MIAAKRGLREGARGHRRIARPAAEDPSRAPVAGGLVMFCIQIGSNSFPNRRIGQRVLGRVFFGGECMYRVPAFCRAVCLAFATLEPTTGKYLHVQRSLSCWRVCHYIAFGGMHGRVVGLSARSFDPTQLSFTGQFIL
jgi:hypothetical protein